jgi:hypothetical protein
MAIGEIKKIACLEGREAEKVIESVMIAPSGRKIRLDVYKIPSDPLNHAVYVFSANDFMQCYNTEKTVILAELARYINDYL